MLRRRLREARKAKHFTQQGMADILEITVGTYQKYESGLILPPVDKLVKIADILDVSLDMLTCRDEFLKKHQEIPR